MRTITKCAAATQKGASCRRPAQENGYCHLHGPEAEPPQADLAPIPTASAGGEEAAPPTPPEKRPADLLEWIWAALRFLLWTALAILVGKGFFAVATFWLAMLIAVSG